MKLKKWESGHVSIDHKAPGYSQFTLKFTKESQQVIAKQGEDVTKPTADFLRLCAKHCAECLAYAHKALQEDNQILNGAEKITEDKRRRAQVSKEIWVERIEGLKQYEAMIKKELKKVQG